uniref:Uncharacterized protein n=1 Tax=Grammatophora oceanica TaxID=210454 RepID=A0A7S1Y4X8_9STRA
MNNHVRHFQISNGVKRPRSEPKGFPLNEQQSNHDRSCLFHGISRSFRSFHLLLVELLQPQLLAGPGGRLNGQLILMACPCVGCVRRVGSYNCSRSTMQKPGN